VIFGAIVILVLILVLTRNGAADCGEQQVLRFAQDDNSNKSTYVLFCPIDFGEQIGLRFVSHQMWIFLAAVIIEFHYAEVICVFYDQLDGRWTGLGGVDRVMPRVH